MNAQLRSAVAKSVGMGRVLRNCMSPYNVASARLGWLCRRRSTVADLVAGIFWGLRFGKSRFRHPTPFSQLTLVNCAAAINLIVLAPG